MKRKVLSLLLIVGAMNVNGQGILDLTEVIADERVEGSRFGNAVCMDGDYVIVGAPDDHLNADGLDSLNKAGSAYIYKVDDFGNWNEIAKLSASDRDRNDRFGWSVSIHGEYAVVGAALETVAYDDGVFGEGAAYIFHQQLDGTWVETQKLIAYDRDLVSSYANFGNSISLNGTTLMVGSLRQSHDEAGVFIESYIGGVYIYEISTITDTSIFTQKIIASDAGYDNQFGVSVNLDENIAIVGAWKASSFDGIEFGHGAAYIFQKDSLGMWYETTKLQSSEGDHADFFGSSVGIDGGRAIVGALYESEDAAEANTIIRSGSAYMFECDDLGVWNQVQKIVGSERYRDARFGSSVAINGDAAIVGSYYEMDTTLVGQQTGAAYLFYRSDLGVWTEAIRYQSENKGVGRQFGASVYICERGLVIGEPNQIYDLDGENYLSQSGAFHVLQSPIAVDDTGIESHELGTNFMLYPNPSSGEGLTMTFEEMESGTLYITNYMGQSILSLNFENEINLNFNLREAAGIYFVETVFSDGSRTTKKLIIR